ncbi:hypothetical protein BgiBS90_020164 [Biomphalaria glabrata]|nr:hypothetical protein BgiBS90_020164 [Biomphalaria glabrata]
MSSTMRTILICFLCFIVDVIDGQVHIIPLTSSVHCYQCDGHHPFPGCLNSPTFCAADEVCAITYASGDPIIRCMTLHDCQNDLAHVTGLCDGGGYEIHPGVCQRCCDNPDCLAQVTNVLSNEYNRDIFCPGQCSSLDLAACIHSQIQCTHGQFCEVTVDDHHIVHGACKAVHELQKCNDDKNKHPCSSALLSGGHGPRCVWDCCTSLDCLNAHFGVFQATALPTSQHVVVVTPAPVQVVTSATALPTSQHVVVVTPAPVQVVTSGTYPVVQCVSCIGAECYRSPSIAQCAGGLCKHTVSHLSNHQVFQEKG